MDSNEGRVYGLCRVSHISSVLSDISIPAQRAAIRSFKRQHYPNMKWGEVNFPDDESRGFFVDRAVSAWKKMFRERPASSQLLRVLKKGDVLLIHSINRGFRNIVDFCQTTAELLSRGVTVRFITEDSVNLSTASGKLMGNLLAALAQYSSDIKSERIKEAYAIKRMRLENKNNPSLRPKKIQWVESELKDFFDIDKPEPKEVTGTVYSYVRCSHQKSLDSELGLLAQESGVDNYVNKLLADNPGLKRGELFRDEAVSAFTTPFKERPAGSKLYESLQPGDHIVVYRLDRAWRSMQDAAKMTEDLIKRGIHIHLVTDGVSTLDDFGKLMFNTLAYVAWMESHMLSRKSLEVIAHLRKQGRPAAAIPIGLKTKMVGGKKKLTLDLDEIANHRAIYELKQILGGIDADYIRDIYIAWQRKKTGLPARKVIKTLPSRRAFYRRIETYPKFEKYFQKRGLNLPKTEGPQDHPEFGQILREALPSVCIRKLRNNKHLEDVLRC